MHNLEAIRDGKLPRGLDRWPRDKVKLCEGQLSASSFMLGLSANEQEALANCSEEYDSQRRTPYNHPVVVGSEIPSQRLPSSLSSGASDILRSSNDVLEVVSDSD